jgi:hypothetical protein
MIYDVCAVLVAKDEKAEDKAFQFLVSASSASHLKLLLEKNLPKGAEICEISVNPDIEQVQVINPKGNKIIRIVTSNPKGDENCEGCELIDKCDQSSFTEIYCVANSVNEVLSKIAELGYDGDLINISVFTAEVTYLY